MEEFSFEKIDYSLRPAKSVERRLIGQSLSFMASAFPLSSYKYVGFGSLWFVDFVLFHRWLRISRMFSIEQAAAQDQMPKRFEFNKPLKCIKVLPGSATHYLPVALRGKRNALVWLDYDGSLESALTGDLGVCLPTLKHGDIVLLSVNAHAGQLKGKRLNDQEISEVEYLEALAPDLVPADAAQRITRRLFPALACEILTNTLRARVSELGSGLIFAPVWSFVYQDGAPMATVGGILLSAHRRSAFDSLKIFDRFDFLSSTGKPVPIAVPIVTLREKLYLDSLMPGAASKVPASLKFEMDPTAWDSYVRFYNYLPTFGELAW